MGIRKRTRSPKTPRRSVRFLQRQNGNSGGSATIRCPSSPHTPTRKTLKHKPDPDTVQRTKIQGAREFLLAKNIPHDPRDIFDQFGVKQRSGYRYIKSESSARTKQGGIKKRGRKNKLSGADVAAADSLLEDTDLGLEAKGITWIAVVWELDLDVAPQTLQKTLRDALGYGKHVPTIKEDLPERTKRDRFNWASATLAKRHTIELWKNVRFSDEFHVGFGPEGQLSIIRKRDNAMRGRFDSIQHVTKPTDTQAIGKVHARAAVGWNFKTPLIYYKVKDKDGAITHKAYIEQILDVEVIKWVNRGDQFVLEEDGASGHGGGPRARKNNPVAEWKKRHNVDTYFNCHDSPDLTMERDLLGTTKAFSTKTTSLGQANTT